MSTDPFGSRATLETPLGSREIARLDSVEGAENLPYSIKVILESALRHLDGASVTAADVTTIAAYDATRVGGAEIPFVPGRVVLQDFTGVPTVVDLAAMRSAIVSMTGDEGSAQRVNPLIPVDLVVDHSVQVDAFARPDALMINSRKEFERNQERYEFLKWGQSAFANFRVVPPATGIVHQVNLEYLAKVVWDDGQWLYPDSLVGTDSHTTMINGLGVVGWGVGGIEAEAAMVGQPIYMLLPEVVGFRLTGRLAEGATATDLVLRVTEMLREHGVVDKFVEFHGPGLADMPVANRATIANMAPEYGATVGFFPVDDRTLEYLRLTGRDDKLIDTVEQYCKTQGLWRDDSRAITYSSSLELDMTTVEPSLAGPRRPQDRIALSAMATQWQADLTNLFGKNGGSSASTVVSWEDEGGRPVEAGSLKAKTGVEVEVDGERFLLTDGDVVIAAITSCTNTSNPDVMIGAGLVARRARELGLTAEALGQVLIGPRLESRHRVSDQLRPARRPRVPRISHRRLRVHHLHRELWAVARANFPRRQRAWARGRVRPLREPQLRRPHLARCESELPRIPALGRGLCPCRNSRLGPDQRAAGPGPGWQGRVLPRHLARSGGGGRSRCSPREPGSVPFEILRGLHRI